MRRLVLILALLFAGPVFATTSFNVWKPQGLIAAVPNTYGNPSVQYTTTDCIIVSNPCFQMWVGDDATGNIYYYESAGTDGITTFTPYASNPIVPPSVAYFPTVYEESGTYYLYASTGGPPSGQIKVFTSSTPIGPWTDHGIQIPKGGTGAWDASGVFQLNIIDIVAGTWYGSFQGYNGVLSQQGLATSPDGIIWTKASGNPNIPNQSGNMTFLKIGGIYYGWGAFLNPNASLQTTQNNPTGRFSASSPAGPWTPLTYSGIRVPTYYVATDAELNNGGGLPAANANDPRIVVANGNIYYYYTWTKTGGVEKGVAVALAQGYTPAQLVATYEGVYNVPFTGLTALNLNVLASDTFQRADGSLGSNWSTLVAGHAAQIVSHTVEGAILSTSSDSYYNAVSFPADQWSKAVSVSLASGGIFGVISRTDTSGANTSYRTLLQPTGANNVIIQSNVAGSFTGLKTYAWPGNPGDTLMVANIGTNLYVYWNDYLTGVISTSSISTGAAGLEVSSSTSLSNASISAWSGGTFQAAPPISGGNAGGRAVIF